MDKKVKGTLPPGWIVRASTKYPDLVYYYNTDTGDSSWEYPALDAPRSAGNSLSGSFNPSIKRSPSDENIYNDNYDDNSIEHNSKFSGPSTDSGTSQSVDNNNIASSNSRVNEINRDQAAKEKVAEKPNVDLNRTTQSNSDEVDGFEFDASKNLEFIDDLIQVDTSSSYYIVLDTNILIHNLDQVIIIHNHNMNDCGCPHIFIPWVVIQELDVLKKDYTLSYMARKAIRFLNKMIVAKHPRFHGQHPKEVKDWAHEYSRCNDNSILECCMNLADRIPLEKVILLTNDLNLVNKAGICDITAYSVFLFWQKFKILTVLKVTQHGSLAQVTQASQQYNYSSAVEKEPDLTNDIPQLYEVSERMSVEEIKIRKIMYKARLLLRKVLYVFLPVELDQSVGPAWRFSGNDYWSLSDHLHLLTEHWNSTFAETFPKDGLADFEYLWTKLNCATFFSFEIAECELILSIIDKIFQAIKRRRPQLDVPIETICNLRVKYIQLQRVIDKNAISEQNSSAPCSDIVVKVFDYNWNVINQLCGVVMDFYGVPHEFSYDRPSLIPSEAEFDRLMCFLYPRVEELKKIMNKVSENRNPNTPPGIKVYKEFCDALKNFVPLLQIEAQPLDTSGFNAAVLMDYFNQPENQEKIAVGYKQLELFFSKLQEALGAMILPRKTV